MRRQRTQGVITQLTVSLVLATSASSAMAVLSTQATDISWRVFTGRDGGPHLRLEELPESLEAQAMAVAALALTDREGFITTLAGRRPDDRLAFSAISEAIRSAADLIYESGPRHPFLELRVRRLSERDSIPYGQVARVSDQLWRRHPPLDLAGLVNEIDSVLPAVVRGDTGTYLNSSLGHAAQLIEADLQHPREHVGVDVNLPPIALRQLVGDLQVAHLRTMLIISREAAEPTDHALHLFRFEGTEGRGRTEEERMRPSDVLVGEGPWHYRVFYGTNRLPVDESDPSEGYRNERDTSGRIHRGACLVFIPESHQFGDTGSTTAIEVLLGAEDDRLKLISTTSLSEAEFLAEIAAILENRVGQSDLVVYIHGYNNTFEETAIRAAQIGYDLKVPGVTAFFSWPSRGRASFPAYAADRQRIAKSTDAIVQFVKELALESGADRIHLIVHSMGNQGLALAIGKMEAEIGARFGQIILAAPDVSPQRFRAVADAYTRLSERTTLYVSSKDRALKTSAWLADEPRVGYAPPVVVNDGIDTIEVTEIDVTMIGHSYYAEAAAVLYDIHDLLTSGRPPSERIRLKKVADGDYWRIGK